MQYFDVYKKKLNSNGGNISNSLLNTSKMSVIRGFKDDPSYKEAKLINSKYEEGHLDIRVVNVDKSVNEKRFVMLPDSMAECGDYINYNDKTFIITEVEYNTVAPVAKGIYCNQTLTWQGLGFEIKCFVTNDAYGSKTLLDNVFLSNTDTKAKIIMQYNNYTKAIKRDWRFIFNKSEYDIFRVTDITTSMDEGIITLITKKDKLMNEDKLEDNIAYIPDFVPVDTVGIQGSDSIKVGYTEDYTINTEEVIYEIDEDNIAVIVNNENNKCTVKALVKDEIFVLYAKDSFGNILDEKIISTKR